MIRVRRSEERLAERSARGAVWLTFFRKEQPDDLGVGFASLEVFAESRLAPGGAALSHDRPETEMVTFVREGVLGWEDSTGNIGLMQAGEFRCTTECRGLRLREVNASGSHGAHVFQIWLRSGRPALEPGRQQKRFTAGERRGRLCLVASSDGRGASLSLYQDASLFSALLDPGAHVTHELLPGHSVWLHVVVGEATLGDVILGTGDSGGITSALAVSLTALKETELLLLDLGPSSPGRRALPGSDR